MGECPNTHSDELKEMYEKARQAKYYGYEEESLRFMKPVVDECDRKITKQLQERSEDVEQVKASMRSATQKETDSMDREVQVLLDKAEKLGAEGNVDESIKLMESVTHIEAKKKNLESDLAHKLEDTRNIWFQKLKPCEICSALLSERDDESRLSEHLSGRIHLGFEAIRNQMAALSAHIQKARTLPRGMSRGDSPVRHGSNSESRRCFRRSSSRGSRGNRRSAERCTEYRRDISDHTGGGRHHTSSGRRSSYRSWHDGDDDRHDRRRQGDGHRRGDYDRRHRDDKRRRGDDGHERRKRDGDDGHETRKRDGDDGYETRKRDDKKRRGDDGYESRPRVDRKRRRSEESEEGSYCNPSRQDRLHRSDEVICDKRDHSPTCNESPRQNGRLSPDDTTGKIEYSTDTTGKNEYSTDTTGKIETSTSVGHGGQGGEEEAVVVDE